jgi:hypothetical protein
VAVVSVVAVVWIVAVSAYAVVASNNGGGGGGLPAFNACIRQIRFLALVRHAPGVVETVRDRERGTREGEVTDDRALGVRPIPILGGVAVGGGPYMMSTATTDGRDANAIMGCWNGPYPIAPGA